MTHWRIADGRLEVLAGGTAVGATLNAAGLEKGDGHGAGVGRPTTGMAAVGVEERHPVIVDVTGRSLEAVRLWFGIFEGKRMRYRTLGKSGAVVATYDGVLYCFGVAR